MAEKRKGRKGKKEVDVVPDENKIPKIEYEVAKYLRNQLPQKKTTLMGHKVDYFIASKAIDALLDSKWAQAKKDSPDALFSDRDSVIDFLNLMLVHKFFHRAQKVIVKPPPKDDKKKSKKGKAEAEVESSAAEESKKKGDKKLRSKTLESESSDQEAKAKEPKKKKEKRTKKVKLDMHLTQMFVDGKEPFVWIYDPIPLKAWFIGFALVVGAVLLCLFPLWPRIVRTYVYYLSVAAAGFLFFIIGLAVLRFIVFVLIWCVTLGRHHFWMLPNLTEDVGFFASFWPLYMHHYKGPEQDGSAKNSPSDNSATPEDENLAEDVALVSKDQESDSRKSSDVDAKANKNEGENGFEILDSQDLGEEAAVISTHA